MKNAIILLCYLILAGHALPCFGESAAEVSPRPTTEASPQLPLAQGTGDGEKGGLSQSEVRLDTSDLFSAIVQRSSTCRLTLSQTEEPQDAKVLYQRLSQCYENLREMLLLANDAKYSLSSRQKTLLLEEGESLLSSLRTLIGILSQRSGDRTFPLLSLVTNMENQLRLYLRSIHRKETWSAEIRVGGGFAKYMDGQIYPLLGGRAALEFDLGDKADGVVALQLATPLAEDSGFIRLPPQESDLVQLSDFWLRSKRFRYLRFRFGIFPDEKSPVTTQSWPFLSAESLLTFLSANEFAWDFRVRHDFAGIYIPGFSASEAIYLERNFSEMRFGQEFDFGWASWSHRFKLQLHWYSDPENALGSLSWGRRFYLSEAMSGPNTKYRISGIAYDAKFRQFDLGELSFEAQSWRNFLAKSDNRGWNLTARLEFPIKEARVGLAANRAWIECASLPPLQLPAHLLPGSVNNYFEVNTRLPLGRGYNWEVGARLFSKAALLPGESCLPKTRPEVVNVPVSEVISIISYEIINDF